MVFLFAHRGCCCIFSKFMTAFTPLVKISLFAHSCRGLTSGRNSSCCKCTRESAFAFPGFWVGSSRLLSYLWRGTRGVLNPALFLLLVGRRVTFDGRIRLKAQKFGHKTERAVPVGAAMPRSPSASEITEVNTETPTLPPRSKITTRETKLLQIPTNFHWNWTRYFNAVQPTPYSYTAPPQWLVRHNQNGGPHMPEHPGSEGGRAWSGGDNTAQCCFMLFSVFFSAYCLFGGLGCWYRDLYLRQALSTQAARWICSPLFGHGCHRNGSSCWLTGLGWQPRAARPPRPGPAPRQPLTLPLPAVARQTVRDNVY